MDITIMGSIFWVGGILFSFILTYQIYITDKTQKEGKESVENAKKAILTQREIYLDNTITYLYSKLGRPKSDFIFKHNSLFNTTKENLKNSLEILMLDIFQHIGLPPTIIELSIIYSINNDRVGQYSRNNYGQRKIEIVIKDNSDSQIVAILCHECTHYFLDTKNIFIPSKMDNEILTDVTTIFLGFGEIMQSGYSEITKMDYETKKTWTYNIGYISSSDIAYIRKNIKSRENLRNIAELKKQEIIKQKIIVERNISLVENLYDSLKNFAEGFQIKNKQINNDQWATIQDIYLAIERNDIDIEINHLKGEVRLSNNLAELKNKDQAINNLCTKICAWNSFLGKNL